MSVIFSCYKHNRQRLQILKHISAQITLGILSKIPANNTGSVTPDGLQYNNDRWCN